MNNKNINERIVNEILKGKEEIKLTQEVSDEVKEEEEYLPGSYNKTVGNLTTMTLRKYINNIINYHGLKYKVSNCNAFIKGCPVEWDLIILKENAIDIDNINVFNAEDVICVFEFKTSGLMRKQFEQIDKTFQTQFTWVKHFSNQYERLIPFGYISYSESYSRRDDIYKGTREYFDKMNGFSNSTFYFLDYDKLKKNQIEFINKDEDFEKYLFNILSKGSNGD